MKNAQDQRRRDPLGRGVYVRCHTAAGVPSRRDILETRLVREGTIMGDKCPTSGERSRHGERLRLIGGRIRACSCTYIGGKYHDDAWVHYLLGGQSLEPRPWSGRAFPTQVRRHSPLSIFLFPRCFHLRYSGILDCYLYTRFSEASNFLHRAIEGITLFILPATHGT